MERTEQEKQELKNIVENFFKKLEAFNKKCKEDKSFLDKHMMIAVKY